MLGRRLPWLVLGDSANFMQRDLQREMCAFLGG